MRCRARMREMPTHQIQPLRALSELRGRRSAVAVPALAVLVALSTVLVACQARPRTIVMDDFEAGAITGWQAVGSGSGGWLVYADGHKPPDPAQSDPNAPLDVPDPPQGKFAAVTDMNGPGTRILYRDLRLQGRFTLQATVFYTGTDPLSSPKTLAYDAPEANQQFRIDLISPSAPIDSVAKGDVLANVFHTSPGDPARRQPTEVRMDVSAWAGQTVRLRLAEADNQGSLGAGVDNIRFEPTDGDADGRVELLTTPRPSQRHRSGPAPAAPSAGAGGALWRMPRSVPGPTSSPGPCSSPATARSCSTTPGAGPTARPASRTRQRRRFRIGSMNKMFTAVATLQLVEAHKLALDDPIGKHLPGYPNKEVAAKVTVRHLLTHTGGTGDIFGPEFEEHRLQLREHRDYLKLYGSRGLTQEPGARFEYSNYGFVLLGALIERVSGVIVRRVCSRPRLPPGRHDVHGVASGIGGGTEPGGRLHAAFPFWWWPGCRIPTPCPGEARRPAAATRPSATCCASPRHWNPERCSRRRPSPRRPAPTSSSTGTALTCKAKGGWAATGTAAGRPA